MCAVFDRDAAARVELDVRLVPGGYIDRADETVVDFDVLPSFFAEILKKIPPNPLTNGGVIVLQCYP